MSDSQTQQSANNAVEFKGRMLTLSVLKLNSSDPEETDAALAAKVQRSADFFRSMPVLLDVPASGLPLEKASELVKKYGMVPVAVFQPSDAVAAEAMTVGLGVIHDPKAARRAESASNGAGQAQGKSDNRPQASATAKQDEAPASRTRVVSEPVRSGQQVYARGGDLVVLGAVSPGAEVLADGNIHVYGALRGRALAGVQGDESARIFCRQLNAELVSVAGCYKISEDIDADVAGRAAQVLLDDGRLEISSL